MVTLIYDSVHLRLKLDNFLSKYRNPHRILVRKTKVNGLEGHLAVPCDVYKTHVVAVFQCIWIKALYFRLFLGLYCSPELKAQVILSDGLLPFISPSSRLLTFHIFIYFSRIMWPISMKLDTKQPWVKGVQVRLNKGPYLSNDLFLFIKIME